MRDNSVLALKNNSAFVYNYILTSFFAFVGASSAYQLRNIHGWVGYQPWTVYLPDNTCLKLLKKILLEKLIFILFSQNCLFLE